MTMHGIGQFDGPLQASSDGILGGPGARSADGELAAYRDGSLGRRSAHGMGEYFAARGMGEYFKPTQGMGEYFRPTQGMGAFLGRGQRAPEGALNLADAATVREVKGAMALLVPQVIMGASATYSPAWFASPSWDAPADALWGNAAQSIGTAGNIDPTTLTVSAPRADGTMAIWPNAAGVRSLLLVFTSSESYGPSYVATNFPALSAWAATPSLDVSPPRISGAMRISKMAVFGLLGAVAVGAAVVMTRKKRKQ